LFVILPSAIVDLLNSFIPGVQLVCGREGNYAFFSRCGGTLGALPSDYIGTGILLF